MARMKTFAAVSFLLASALVACKGGGETAAKPAAAAATAPAAAPDKGWVTLFDGKDLSNFRGARTACRPRGP